jgi:hypothetical protein
MPFTMALAAAFSREDAKQNGIVVIWADASALGQDVVLEPFLNLVRDIAFARTYNTSGRILCLPGSSARPCKYSVLLAPSLWRARWSCVRPRLRPVAAARFSWNQAPTNCFVNSPSPCTSVSRISRL